jgi:hypothetical protein
MTNAQSNNWLEGEASYEPGSVSLKVGHWCARPGLCQDGGR